MLILYRKDDFPVKKIIILALVLALTLAILPSAAVADLGNSSDDDVPLRLTVVSGSLTFSGTTANCSGTVTNPDKYIVATMTLSHGGSTVASWSNSGYSCVILSGSCTVKKGWSYTLVISGTADGVPFSSTPITKTCK